MEYDVVVIGSGPAGLTAGIYLSMANKRILIIENSILGGTLSTLDNIQNYPGYSNISGLELAQNMYVQAINLGVEFLFDNIESIDYDKYTINLKDKKIKYKALIIAGGTSVKKTTAENEDKFYLKGISYCAVCDGNLYKNRKVIVITDNNSAKSSINYLKNITKNITVLNVSAEDYIDNEVEVINNVTINSFKGDNKLESVIYTKEGVVNTINCDGCFVALGKQTDLSLYQNTLSIEKNHIITDGLMRTNINGVYAVGDIRNTPLRQIVTACADGAIAATEAIKYINKLI